MKELLSDPEKLAAMQAASASAAPAAGGGGGGAEKKEEKKKEVTSNVENFQENLYLKMNFRCRREQVLWIKLFLSKTMDYDFCIKQEESYKKDNSAL